MRRTLTALAALGTLLGINLTPGSAADARVAPEPVTRQHLLTLDDHATVHPDMRDPILFVGQCDAGQHDTWAVSQSERAFVDDLFLAGVWPAVARGEGIHDRRVGRVPDEAYARVAE